MVKRGQNHLPEITGTLGAGWRSERLAYTAKVKYARVPEVVERFSSEFV